MLITMQTVSGKAAGKQVSTGQARECNKSIAKAKADQYIHIPQLLVIGILKSGIFDNLLQFHYFPIPLPLLHRRSPIPPL